MTEDHEVDSSNAERDMAVVTTLIRAGPGNGPALLFSTETYVQWTLVPADAGITTSSADRNGTSRQGGDPLRLAPACFRISGMAVQSWPCSCRPICATFGAHPSWFYTWRRRRRVPRGALSAHFAQGGRVQEANRPTNGLLDSLRLCDLELHEVSRAFCAATRQTPVHAPCCAWTYARA